MRFDINLASQPYQDVQRFLVRWGLGLFAIALLTVGLVYAATTAFLSWRVTDKQIHYLQQQIADRDRQKAEVQAFLARPENRETRDRSQFLNALIARKAFSWTEVFTDLENIMPPRLHVTAIRPEINADDQLQLHLTVVGSSRESAIALVRRLEQSPHFTQAQVQQENARQTTGGGGDAVQFEILAIYLPAFARPQKQAVPERATGVAEQPGTAKVAKQKRVQPATEARK